MLSGLAVEHDDGRVAALEHIDAVLVVGRDPADQAERLAVRRFEEIADNVVFVGHGVSSRGHRGIRQF